jgi:hypothetical protein
MAQLIQPFNALQFDPTQGAGQLPIGKHVVIAEKSEIKPTKGNDGGFLEFGLKIVEGQQAGVGGAWRLNLYNASQQAVEIANKQMSALCHVTGVFNVTDSSQLHNIPFMVEVAPQKDNPQYTEVKRVFDRNGNEPKAGQQGQQAQQQQPVMQGQSNPVDGFGSNAPQGQQQPQNGFGQGQGQGQGGQAFGGGQQPQGQQQQPQNGQWQQQQPQGGNSAPAWGAPQGQQQQPQGQQQQQPAWGAQR